MPIRRILLAPFALLWGLALRVRHLLYDIGLLRSVRPVQHCIVVGNLELGGTGKTPHVEWVIRSLQGDGPLATLSRGYGRRGNELREVLPQDQAGAVGDEPAQIKRKFPFVRVFVGVDRVRALEAMAVSAPEAHTVVLDDAFQHRRLRAGLNILLTTFQTPYCDDTLFPTGRLRDLRSRASSAEIVIVTKCPEPPDIQGEQRWRERLGLRPDQELFFSSLEHGPATWLHAAGLVGPVLDGPGTSALVVTGIVRPAPLLEHARTHWGQVEHIAFPDHHPFSPTDLARLATRSATFARSPGVVLTTEKDAVRLAPLIAGSPLENIPIAVVPITVRILNDPDRLHALLRSHPDPHRSHGPAVA